MNRQRLAAVVRKEFQQFVKDKKLLPLVFVAPVLQLTFLGFAASLDVKNIAVVLCDLDKTSESRAFAAAFTNSGYFTVEETEEDQRRLADRLDDGNAAMALVIPHGFGERVVTRRSVTVQVLLDGSEGNSAAIASGYIGQIVNRYSQEKLAAVAGDIRRLGGVSAEARAWYNPTLVSRRFMVPGVMVLILLITTMLLTSMAIVREKEIGTLEQLLVTPLRPAEVIVGKLLPFVLIGLIVSTVAMLVIVFGFGIPVRGSLLLLLAMTLLFMLASLGLGLLVSTVSRTQQQAMMIGMFFILQPMMYLSGFVFPVENMPEVLQWVAAFIPMKYYLTAIRSIMLKGTGLADLWPEALALLVMGSAILWTSVKRFREKAD